MKDKASMDVQFCDDIRQELGNKYSMMGIYGLSLTVPAVPTLIPRLCVQTRISTPKDVRLTRAIFRVFRDDVLVYTISAEPETLRRSREEAPKESSTTLLTAIAVMTPFEVIKPCVVRVKVETDEGEMSSEGLSIISSGQQSDSKAMWTPATTDDDETEDAFAAAEKLGYKAEDFEIERREYTPPSGGVAHLVAEVYVRYRLTGIKRKYDAGSGTSWPIVFERDLQAGAFARQ